HEALPIEEPPLPGLRRQAASGRRRGHSASAHEMRIIMLRFISASALLLPLVLFAPLAQAQEAPDALVKRVAEETLAAIRADKELQAGNPAKVQQLIQSQLLPQF